MPQHWGLLEGGTLGSSIVVVIKLVLVVIVLVLEVLELIQWWWQCLTWWWLKALAHWAWGR